MYFAFVCRINHSHPQKIYFFIIFKVNNIDSMGLMNSQLSFRLLVPEWIFYSRNVFLVTYIHRI